MSELEVVIKSEVTKILLSLLGHLQSLLLQLVNHFIGQPRTFPCSGQVKMMDNAPKNHTKMKYKLIINLPPLFFWLHIFINYNLYILFIHYFRYSTIIINIYVIITEACNFFEWIHMFDHNIIIIFPNEKNIIIQQDIKKYHL